MYTLYHQDGTRSTAALLVLEEAGLLYELHTIDITADDHKRDEFRKINPRGLIPTLLTDTGEVLSETAAIMMYLADRHEVTDLAPLPTEPGRGTLHDWLFYHVGEVQEAGKRNAYPNRYSTDIADVPRIRMKAGQTQFERWKIVDDHLAKNGPYHLGERFSLVELYMAMTAVWIMRAYTAAGGTDEGFDFALSDLPAVERCYELVAARPKSGPILERHKSELQTIIARGLPE